MADFLAPFRWLDHPENALDDIFCVSFFRDLTPTDVLRRFGSGPGEEMSLPELAAAVDEFVSATQGAEGGGHVGVVQANGWSIAVELSGWDAAMWEYCADFSRDCELVAISRHDYAEDTFLYAVDGEAVTCFTPIPGRPTGSGPNRLNEAMQKLGMPTGLMDDDEWEAFGVRLYEETTARAFALAAEITGVPFTRDLLTFPLLVGPIARR